MGLRYCSGLLCVISFLACFFSLAFVHSTLRLRLVRTGRYCSGSKPHPECPVMRHRQTPQCWRAMIEKIVDQGITRTVSMREMTLPRSRYDILQLLASHNNKTHSPHYLQVHVRIDRDQEALVFLSPLQLDHDGLSGQIVKEWLGVDGHELDRHVKVGERMFQLAQVYARRVLPQW